MTVERKRIYRSICIDSLAHTKADTERIVREFFAQNGLTITNGPQREDEFTRTYYGTKLADHVDYNLSDFSWDVWAAEQSKKPLSQQDWRYIAKNKT